MSADCYTIDTNVLVYMFDKDAKQKHLKALQLLERLTNHNTVLILQVLCEFFNVVTRKNKLDANTALKHIQDFQSLFPVISAEPGTLIRAIDLVNRHTFSFWDAMICSVAKTNGVTKLLSEDLQNGRSLSGMTIINPFTEEPW